MAHSPTPWKLERNLGGNYNIVADGCWLDDRFGPGHSRIVAQTHHHFGSEDPEVEGNAEFIVHAVNCHDELVAALEEVDRYDEYALSDKGKAALAKAKRVGPYNFKGEGT